MTAPERIGRPSPLVRARGAAEPVFRRLRASGGSIDENSPKNEQYKGSAEAIFANFRAIPSLRLGERKQYFA